MIDPTNPMVAYAVRYQSNPAGTAPIETGHVFRTADGGGTWTDITVDLPDTAVNAIAVNVVGGTTQIWVGTNRGVYASTDLGASWSTFGDELPNATVTSLEYVASSNILLAGTYGRGAWEILDQGALLVPPAPQLAAGSDTGVSSTDGLTRDNGSSSAPVTFTVSGVSPLNGFVQLYDVTDPGGPLPLGGPEQAIGGIATITLGGGGDLPLADGVHRIAATAAVTSGGAPSAVSGSTAVTIQTSVHIVSTTPAAGSSVAVLPGGQVTILFDHTLANLTDGGGALGPNDPNALTLTTAGGQALAITTVYHVDTADGTSSIVLTPVSPPMAAVETLRVTPGAFTDLAGNTVSTRAAAGSRSP